MTRTRRAALCVVAALACGGAPAAAEHLVASVSTQRVQVTSNFTGTELVLFGTVDPDPPSGARAQTYDRVATVSGPRQSLLTRRKDRVLRNLLTNLPATPPMNTHTDDAAAAAGGFYRIGVQQ